MGDVLAIVGSTTFVDTTALDVAQVAIEGVLQRRAPDRVVSGAAAGIDTLGVRLARKYGVEVTEFPPAYHRWEPDGYKARNDRVADACTRLMRIVCRWSVTYGSGYTHDRARAQAKVCWSLVLPATVTTGLVYAQVGQATVGLDVQDGRVANCPPYARRLGWVGRDADKLVGELVRRRVVVRWVPDPDVS